MRVTGNELIVEHFDERTTTIIVTASDAYGQTAALTRTMQASGGAAAALAGA